MSLEIHGPLTSDMLVQGLEKINEEPVLTGQYVIYSPTSEKYLWVELMSEVTMYGEYKLQWEDNFDRASLLDDDTVNKLLDACRVAFFVKGVQFKVNWYNFVAFELQSMWVRGEIASLSELILVPRTKRDVPSGSGLPVTQMGVDFVLSEELFAGFPW